MKVACAVVARSLSRCHRGVDTGTRIQLQGEGEVGPNGGSVGDLFVEVVVAPDPVFERHGDELHCVVKIPMSAAALGTSVHLDTLDGPEDLTVPAGTQAGGNHHVAGQGCRAAARRVTR